MPFNPFSALTSKLFAATSGILLIALGVMFLLHKHDLATADKLRNELAASNAKLAVSNTSIDLLTAKIAEMNAETERRAADFAAAQKQAADARLKLAEREKASDALIDRLKARAAQGGSECVVPSDLKQLAEGL